MTDSLKYTPDPTSNPPIVSSSDCVVEGLFIVFEGGDGAGKSTQVARLEQALTQEGYDVISTREPGGTDIGEKLRGLVLEHGQGIIDARTEALIYAASRSAHAEQKIRPALAAGKIVLCDRYIDSSAAYQGAGRNLGTENITQLSLWATQNLLPDLTVFIDVPLDAGRQRTDSRGAADRLESEPDEFHTLVHQTFGELAGSGGENYAIVDGTGSIDDVHGQILRAVKRVLKERAA